MSSDTPSSPDWRDDDGWRPIAYDPSLCEPADIPSKPTAAAELAPQPLWASLYENHRIVVIWWRPQAAPPRDATMVAEDERA